MFNGVSDKTGAPFFLLTNRDAKTIFIFRHDAPKVINIIIMYKPKKSIIT